MGVPIPALGHTGDTMAGSSFSMAIRSWMAMDERSELPTILTIIQLGDKDEKEFAEEVGVMLLYLFT